MKKILIILIIAISGCGFSQEKNKVNWSLSVETTNSFQAFTSNFNYILSEKIYLSNWSTWVSKGQLESEGSYGLSLYLFNYKPNETFTISAGHIAVENYTFKGKKSYGIIRLTCKIL
jgi:dihydrofolate reductase